MVLADCEKPLASMRSNRRIFRIFETKLYSSLEMWETNIEQKRDSCPNYEMRFAPEAGLMRVSWDSLFGNLFRACPAPLGEGGAKRRVRAGNAPSSGPSGHLLP